jgi:hypothetical protein
MRIYGIVKEHGERGEKIYLTKLKTVLGREASMRTIQKRLCELVDDGILDVHPVTVGRATYKYLYISGSGRNSGTDGKLDEIRGKINIIMRMLRAIERR